MIVALLIGQAITGVFGILAVLVLRGALRDQASTFSQINERDHAERHVLAGRIQRPELFPVRPVTADGPQVPTEVAQSSDAAAFEAAGGAVEDADPGELEKLFGPGFGD